MEETEEGKTEESDQNGGWKRECQNDENEKERIRDGKKKKKHQNIFAELFDRIKDPLIMICKVRVFMELHSYFNYLD